MLAFTVALVVLAPGRLSRTEFLSRLSTLKPGSLVDDVRRLLGPPDDVLTRADAELLQGDEVERWNYGTNGHGSFPTLASISVKDGRAWWRKPILRPGPKISDDVMREALRALDGYCPSLERFTGFPRQLDPLCAIRAAIKLRPLGKNDALACIRQYGELTDPSLTIPVLQLLFELPPEHDPRQAYFRTRIENDVPQPPLSVAEDIPAFTLRTDSLPPDCWRAFVDACEQYGSFRTTPICPTISRGVLLRSRDNVHMAMLLRSVFDVGDPSASDMESQIIRNFDKWLDGNPSVPTWDASQEAFVEGSSKPLPEKVRVRPVLTQWQPKSPSRARLDVACGWTQRREFTVSVRFLSVEATNCSLEVRGEGAYGPVVLASFPLDDSPEGWGGFVAYTEGPNLKNASLSLDSRNPVQLFLVGKGWTLPGPVISPFPG